MSTDNGNVQTNDISQTSRNAPQSSYDVVIVGAGWSGLAAAKTYLQVHPTARLLMLDEDTTLGGTWSKNRLYPHLRAEAVYGLFEFSDLKMGKSGITPEGWITGPAVHNYLNDYAAKFGLHEHIRLGSRVDQVERIEDTRSWKLTIRGADEPLFCDKLVVATGLTSEPWIPPIDKSVFKGPIFHSKELGKAETNKTLDDDKIEEVVVYGGSKSSFDATYLLIKAGKKVNWIVRPDGGGPSIMTPRKIMGMSSIELNNTRLFGLFSPNVFRNGHGWTSKIHGPSLHHLSRYVVTGFWRLMTFMIQMPAHYSRSQNGLLLKPKMGLDATFWSPATLGVMTYDTLWDEIHRGDNIRVYSSAISTISDTGVNLEDGRSVRADSIVFATGWKTRHSMFSTGQLLDHGVPSQLDFETSEKAYWQRLRDEADEAIQETLPILSNSPEGYLARCEDDYHLYRFMVPSQSGNDDRSIAFIGFLRNTGLPIMLEAQALWITAYFDGSLDVPSKSDRDVEIAKTNAWIRRRYVCGRKVPFALVDWLPYIDMLYRDLGINSYRKGNALLEMFSFYRPSDFNGVVKEWLASRSHGQPKDRKEEVQKSAMGRSKLTIISSILCAALVCVSCNWITST
ncbi:hypothetical protein E6O75_ATG09278 [Venturia nashicola]|uniref:FAD/NAD(P)-binding domain-containing protein n=1 Tax=Venturia nashicola TaxID=86259 RepID=A0A4Z1NI10_9PEZI|nr:hypothetical protein E6O75_ATG09278 [Venturia nashicola]